MVFQEVLADLKSPQQSFPGPTSEVTTESLEDLADKLKEAQDAKDSAEAAIAEAEAAKAAAEDASDQLDSLDMSIFLAGLSGRQDASNTTTYPTPGIKLRRRKIKNDRSCKSIV